MAKRIIKRNFNLEIAVAVDEIANKYPNYRFNFDNPTQFIEMLINDLKFIGETDMSKEGMEKWGYSIVVKNQPS
jgi:hypothetical protein